MTNLTNLNLLDISDQAYQGMNASDTAFANLGYQRVVIDLTKSFTDSNGNLKDFDEHFSAVAYYNPTTNHLTMGFGGTDDLSDFFVNDPGYVVGYQIPQFDDAVGFYDAVISDLGSRNINVPNDNILLTGHSHGGGLSAMVGIFKDVVAKVFNAPDVERQLDNIEEFDDIRDIDGNLISEGSINEGDLTSRDPASFKITNTFLESDVVHLAGGGLGVKDPIDSSNSILGTVLYALFGVAGATLMSNPIGAGIGILAKFIGAGISSNHMISGLRDALENQEEIASGNADQTTTAKFLNAVGSINAYIDTGISSVIGAINGAIDWMTSGNVISDLTDGAKDAWESTTSFFEGLFNGHSGEAPTNNDGTINHNLINNSLLDFTSNISPTSHNATANPDDFSTGSALSGGDYSANMPVDTINGDGLDNTSLSQIVTDNYRPGAQTLADNNLNNILDRAVNFINQNVIQPIADIASNIWGGIQSTFASLTNLFTQAPQVQNVDPLILDLNNNGVELIHFDNSIVSFDVDNDGYKENTGWVDGNDGILVHDKNADGIINDITETISEYYNANDTSVLIDDQNRYFADGLEALKALDSNDDNIFNREIKTLRFAI